MVLALAGVLLLSHAATAGVPEVPQATEVVERAFFSPDHHFQTLQETGEYLADVEARLRGAGYDVSGFVFPAGNFFQFKVWYRAPAGYAFEPMRRFASEPYPSTADAGSARDAWRAEMRAQDPGFASVWETMLASAKGVRFVVDYAVKLRPRVP